MFLDHSFSRLIPEQVGLVDYPFQAKIYLEGPAGSGKTTAAVERLLRFMAAGIPGSSILLLVPQRTLAEPYYQALNHPGVISGGVVTVLTVGGLAQRMVDLFWPLVTEKTGFSHPDRAPVFLTLETAQYYMAHLVAPLIKDSMFESLSMDRNRLYSQIVDNLNKAAVVGFSITEIGERLKEAWVGEPGQMRIYEDVQECAILFRRFCLEHNLLDYSLQMQIFRSAIWPDPLCRAYLNSNYRHLIYDNLEEDVSVAHDIVREWLPDFDSALLIYDWQGGFRRFLGADTQTALGLRDLCTEQAVFSRSLVMSEPIEALVNSLSNKLTISINDPAQSVEILPARAEQHSEEGLSKPFSKTIRDALVFEQHHFYPEMLDWITDQIVDLIYHDDVPPSEIVILSPFLSDALRFSVINRLENRQVPVHSHRPSRSLREEPATRCLLTLSNLAYPEWNIIPTKFDVAQALMQAIAGLDRVRAQLLTEIVYRTRAGIPTLSSFEQIKPETQARITFRVGERYEELRAWLARRREPPDEFDHFLSRMFGEILSQSGFGFHDELISGEITANLIESVQKFRRVAGVTLTDEGIPLGKEFIQMIQDGVIAAQYVRSWQSPPEDAVLIAPAFTYLMSNRPVRFQFWLDAGNRGWSERLNQPLTQPYVLSREWARGRLWTDYDEVQAGHDLLSTLVLGLLHRCRERIYLGISELGEQGYETRGPLLQVIQRVLLSIGKD